jgi:pyruvate formate lyase activating enzyme
MREAKYYTADFKGKGCLVQCNLCPRNCVIPEGAFGNCGARKNIKGKLYSMVYGKAVAVAIDPIEKKPLFHFLPGSRILSWGTAGCNLHCKHCQNWTTSQARAGEYPEEDLAPAELVKAALDSSCESIAATYNEPTVFYEYMYDAFRLAKKSNIKTVAVTNGFINEKPLKDLLPYLDGANVDLKSFDESFYREVASAELKPVLNTLKIINKSKTWLEITNLIIPTLNDDLGSIKKMCKWIRENLGVHVPLHFSAFYPCYKLANLPPTPEEILIKARRVAQEAGLKYVYVGNIQTEDGETTFCPNCKKLLIKRAGFFVATDDLKGNRCRYCNAAVDGVFC